MKLLSHQTADELRGERANEILHEAMNQNPEALVLCWLEDGSIHTRWVGRNMLALGCTDILRRDIITDCYVTEETKDS